MVSCILQPSHKERNLEPFSEYPQSLDYSPWNPDPKNVGGGRIKVFYLLWILFLIPHNWYIQDNTPWSIFSSSSEAVLDLLSQEKYQTKVQIVLLFSYSGLFRRVRVREKDSYYELYKHVVHMIGMSKNPSPLTMLYLWYDLLRTENLWL